MIIQWDSVKFGRSRGFFSTGFAAAGVGKATRLASVPKAPSLPIMPDSDLPRPWVIYFEDLHAFLKEHINDNQMHNIK